MTITVLGDSKEILLVCFRHGAKQLVKRELSFDQVWSGYVEVWHYNKSSFYRLHHK